MRILALSARPDFPFTTVLLLALSEGFVAHLLEPPSARGVGVHLGELFPLILEVVHDAALELAGRELEGVQLVVEGHTLEVSAVLLQEIDNHRALLLADGLALGGRGGLGLLELHLHVGLDDLLLLLDELGARGGVDGEAEAGVVLRGGVAALNVHLRLLVVRAGDINLADVLETALEVLLLANAGDGGVGALLSLGGDLQAGHG